MLKCAVYRYAKSCIFFFDFRDRKQLEFRKVFLEANKIHFSDITNNLIFFTASF